MKLEALMRDKKGQLPNVFIGIIGLVLGLIVATIVMSIGGDVLENLEDQQLTGLAVPNQSSGFLGETTNQVNITRFGVQGVLNVAEFNPTFGTIIVLGAILLLLGSVITAILVFNR